MKERIGHSKMKWNKIKKMRELKKWSDRNSKALEYEQNESNKIYNK